jgi:SAM-dependent methyltransferase
MKESVGNEFFEYTNCFVCNDASRKKVYRIDHALNEDLLQSDEKPEVYIYKCNHCGHFYKNPILNSDFMNHYYSELNSVFYKKRAPAVDKNRHKANIKIVKTIENYKKKGNVLEIGCGYGYLLSCFDADKWHRFGIEPSPYASEFARSNQGLDVFTGLLENHPYEKESFDAILLIDVFEHLRNPIELFENIKYLLKPHGIIYLKTGSIERIIPKISKSKWIYHNTLEHISFITKSSIKYITIVNSLTVIKKRKISHTPFFYLNLLRFITALIKNFIKYIYSLFNINTQYQIKIPIVFDHCYYILRKNN